MMTMVYEFMRMLLKCRVLTRMQFTPQWPLRSEEERVRLSAPRSPAEPLIRRVPPASQTSTGL